MKHNHTETHGHNFEILHIVLSSQSISIIVLLVYQLFGVYGNWKILQVFILWMSV